MKTPEPEFNAQKRPEHHQLVAWSDRGLTIHGRYERVADWGRGHVAVVSGYSPIKRRRVEFFRYFTAIWSR